MGLQVVHSAVLQCSFGMAPSSLMVPPKHRVLVGGMPAANIMDQVPMLNILSFGMCSSRANPTVAAATAAALGVLTPMPCIPVITAPWFPGSPTVLIDALPALNNTSKCLCAWAGVISVTVPGQIPTAIP
jgi:hypothetical protein